MDFRSHTALGVLGGLTTGVLIDAGVEFATGVDLGPVFVLACGAYGGLAGNVSDLDHPEARPSRTVGPLSFAMRRWRRDLAVSARKVAVPVVGVGLAVAAYWVGAPQAAVWIGLVGLLLTPLSPQICEVAAGPMQRRWNTMPLITRLLRKFSRDAGMDEHRGLTHMRRFGLVPAFLLGGLSALVVPWWMAVFLGVATFAGFCTSLVGDALTKSGLDGSGWAKLRGRITTAGGEFLFRMLVLLGCAFTAVLAFV